MIRGTSITNFMVQSGIGCYISQEGVIYTVDPDMGVTHHGFAMEYLNERFPEQQWIKDTYDVKDYMVSVLGMVAMGYSFWLKGWDVCYVKDLLTSKQQATMLTILDCYTNLEEEPLDKSTDKITILKYNTTTFANDHFLQERKRKVEVKQRQNRERWKKERGEESG